MKLFCAIIFTLAVFESALGRPQGPWDWDWEWYGPPGLGPDGSGPPGWGWGGDNGQRGAPEWANAQWQRGQQGGPPGPDPKPQVVDPVASDPAAAPPADAAPPAVPQARTYGYGYGYPRYTVYRRPCYPYGGYYGR